MMFTGKNARFLHAGGLAVMVLLCACDRAPVAGVAEKDDSSLPPAILPAEVADPAEPPSYEVGIATAAADRNHAKEKCVDLPQLERETCEAAADSKFATAEADLDDLRGNQQ